jgi:hypothetical protein
MLDRVDSGRRQRQARYRRRQRDGVTIYPVPLPGKVVEILFEWHWFDETADRNAIGQAISRELAKSTRV